MSASGLSARPWHGCTHRRWHSPTLFLVCKICRFPILKIIGSLKHTQTRNDRSRSAYIGLGVLHKLNELLLRVMVLRRPECCCVNFEKVIDFSEPSSERARTLDDCSCSSRFGGTPAAAANCHTPQLTKHRYDQCRA